MKMRTHIVLILLALLAVAGCAKTKLSDRQEYTGGKLPRPENILVYDFAATATDLSDDSALAGRISEHDTPQTAEQIETGRKVGAEIAAHLVAEIRAMGMPAERASAASKAQINDVVIRGYLLSVKKGDALERVAIGLGAGASELTGDGGSLPDDRHGPAKAGRRGVGCRRRQNAGSGGGSGSLDRHAQSVGLDCQHRGEGLRRGERQEYDRGPRRSDRKGNRRPAEEKI